VKQARARRRGKKINVFREKARMPIWLQAFDKNQVVAAWCNVISGCICLRKKLLFPFIGELHCPDALLELS
jgi:hypothetical protein